MLRNLVIGIVATVVLQLVAAPAGIAWGAVAETHEGKVLTVGERTISILDTAGNTERFTVAEDAEIVHDGKKAPLADIDNGDIATITTKVVAGKTVAIKIVARSME